MGYFRFFTHSGLFTALYPTLSNNIFFLKSQNFHGDIVKNESARAKKLEGGPNAPPPRLFIVNERLDGLQKAKKHISP